MIASLVELVVGVVIELATELWRLTFGRWLTGWGVVVLVAVAVALFAALVVLLS